MRGQQNIKKQVVAFKYYVQDVRSFRFKSNECRRICFLEPSPRLNIVDRYKSNRGIDYRRTSPYTKCRSTSIVQ